VRRPDVLVESFRPGVTERLGIDHETRRARRPELVHASISGFGQTGPWS
jgi:formyl-CoA transferase